ncbi:MAG TPA: sigma-70 family RNA polymerase sigma factor [Candidatus Saccharimonadales bacterium]|nr:sigma-70 family RNA polymerase sigma factor [Candidatus Saccharimonadales bacterium]
MRELASAFTEAPQNPVTAGNEPLRRNLPDEPLPLRRALAIPEVAQDAPDDPFIQNQTQIVNRAKAGDPDGQAAIFDFYWPKIVGYSYAHCGNPHDAEDIASEVFLRMVDSIGRFQWRENVPFSAWLFRIARNQIVTHYRKRGSALPFMDDIENEYVGYDGSMDEIADDLDRRAQLERINQAAQALPNQQKAVFEMRFGRDLTLAETAGVLNMPQNQVKQNQHKAIARIKQVVHGEESEEQQQMRKKLRERRIELKEVIKEFDLPADSSRKDLLLHLLSSGKSYKSTELAEILKCDVNWIPKLVSSINKSGMPIKYVRGKGFLLESAS